MKILDKYFDEDQIFNIKIGLICCIPIFQVLFLIYVFKLIRMYFGEPLFN